MNAGEVKVGVKTEAEHNRPTPNSQISKLPNWQENQVKI